MTSSKTPAQRVTAGNSNATRPGESQSGSSGTDSTRSNRGRHGGRPSRREELLWAAVELFATAGTRGTTLEAIAKQIGVTKTAIIHHFRTKENLLREVS